MRVLQICSKPPYPPADGGALAMNMITQGLLESGNEVRLLVINTNKNKVCIDDLPSDYVAATQIEAVYVDLGLKSTDALKNLVFNRSYHVERFKSKNLENKLIEILTHDRFDIIQLETLYLTPYIDIIRKYTDVPVILRSHNIEHKIWEAVAERETNYIKRSYLDHLARTLKSYELKHLSSYDGIAAITSNDRDYYLSVGCSLPVVTIPYGIDPFIPLPPVKKEFSLFSIGAMNWIPNQEGIRWFIDRIWDKLQNSHPGLIYRIAGRDMPHWMKTIHKSGIEVVGEVNDSMEFIRNNTVMLVPLFAGSGVRVKIIEGMSACKTIISTAVGASGIECEDGENILIANNEEDFIEKIERCITDPCLIQRIGSKAGILIREKHDTKKIMNQLLDFYNIVINLKKTDLS